FGGPDGGRAEDVARHHLPGDGDGHGDDQPGGGPARPVGDLVDGLDGGPERRRDLGVGADWRRRDRHGRYFFFSGAFSGALAAGGATALPTGLSLLSQILSFQ